MNLFLLHPDPDVTAALLVDCHVVKMPLEAAQVAMTVFHLHPPADDWAQTFQAALARPPYRPTHKAHPVVLWAASGLTAYAQLLQYGLALCREYTLRYERQHASEPVLLWCQEHLGDLPLPAEGAPPVQCMPDEHKGPDVFAAYQNYYLAKLCDWAADPARAHMVKGGVASFS